MIGWGSDPRVHGRRAAVSVGWSGYAVAFVHDVLGITLSPTWTRAPFVYDEVLRQFPHATGAILNIPAMLITAVVTEIPSHRHQRVGTLQHRDCHREGRGGAGCSSPSARGS